MPLIGFDLSDAHADEEGTSGQPRRKAWDPSAFIIAAHVCDFGNVVSGTTRKRVFKVTNTSATGPLSWVFDKNLLIGSGFSIEPEKVVRLPEGASATFQVNFNAKKSIPLGEKEHHMPVDVKNGPLTVILLRANVTVPEVSVSQDALDFGDVWVGCARVMHLQLQNTSPVVAEWDFKKAMGSAKDEAKFRLEPRGGVLQPGQRCNVAVEFVPLEHRGHALKLPLKVNQSPKTKLIAFSGSGVQANVVFDPPLIDLGPILPYSAGDAGTVTMTNNSERPVEVYALDFDLGYLEEEEVLRSVSGYGADDMMRLPVREPGHALPEDIVEES